MYFLKVALFLSILSIINSVEKIELNGKEIIKKYSSVERQKTYQIIINTEVDNYLKIEIEGQESELINHVVDFSNTESSLNRTQLAQSIKNITIMWIKKEQLKNDNNFINVHCSKYLCHYTIRLTFMNKIEINVGEQYTYYVSENNKEMLFNFNIVYQEEEDFDYDKDIISNTGEYTTFWAIGSKTIKTNLNNEEGNRIKYENEYGEIYNLKTSELNTKIFPFKITGEIGDLITVGANQIENDFSVKHVYLNYPEIIGFLQIGFSTNVCYKLSNILKEEYGLYEQVFLHGIVFDQTAEVYFKNKNGDEISSTTMVVTSGYIIDQLEADIFDEYSFCVRIPTEDEEKYNVSTIAFSIQLTAPQRAPLKTAIFQPQRLGKMYPRNIPFGEIMIFTSFPPINEKLKLKYNIHTILGHPEMHFDKCNNYPMCIYDNTTIKNAMTIHDINSVSQFSSNVENGTTVISPVQNLLLIQCTGGNRKSSINNKLGRLCEFDSLILTEEDKILLREVELFSQFLLEGEKNKFTINFNGQTTVQKIYVDVMIFTGDVVIETESGINENKFQHANKLYYSVYIDPNSSRKEINFSVRAKKNSYYSIMYTLIKYDDDSWLENTISTGINFLVTINPNAVDKKGVPMPKKILKFINQRQVDEFPFLVNFLSLNCRLFITATRFEDRTYIQEPIINDDYYYSQDILNKDMISYFWENYEYTLTIAEMDFTKSKNKLCMTYVSALDLGDDITKSESHIVVSENVQQQIIFKQGYKRVKYLYPHPNPLQDLILRFHLVDKAKYDVNIYVEKENIGNFKITSSGEMYLYNVYFYYLCNKDQVCSIEVEITCDENVIENEPKLEFAIKMVTSYGTPTYLPKNQARFDYLNGAEWQHYYTDIGKEEEGDVVVNFFRGCGKIFGRIVPKKITKPDDDADWQEIYRFPKTEEDSLKYIPYLKKLVIEKNDTEKCEEGCYLLLSLQSSIKGGLNLGTNEHGFNLIVQTGPVDKEKEEMPLRSIPLEEYIVGDINATPNKPIITFYSIYFPHDAEAIVIDFQSEAANIYINIDSESEKPKITSADFVFYSKGQDTLYKITKSEFVEKARERGILGENENNIKGLSIIIGIWTNQTDTIFTTVYSLKVHLTIHSDLDIYEVNSDQKILCQTTNVDSKYRCLFMILYEKLDVLNNILIYPTLQDKSAKYSIYAEFIPEEQYELYNESFIKSNIPNENSTLSTIKSKEDFIFLSLSGKSENYLFVNIITDKNTTIELMTSFYTYDSLITPNPSSPQIFQIRNEFLNLSFNNQDDIMINIISLTGEAQIYWDSDPNIIYNIKSKEKRISLSSPKNTLNQSNTNSTNKLVIKNLYPETFDTEEEEYQIFAFYLTYTLRNKNLNIDELQFGQSCFYGYENTNFPLVLFTRLDSIDKDTNVFFNFYDLLRENNNNLLIEKKQYEINAIIIKSSDLYKIKSNERKLPDFINGVKGIYDPSIKTGIVSLKKDKISNFNIKLADRPILMVQIEKPSSNDKQKQINKIWQKSTVIQSDSGVPISENIYQHGKLYLNSEKNVYKLKLDKSKKIMRIVFSTNGGFIDWAISKIEGGAFVNETFTILSSNYNNGRSLLTLKLRNETIDYIYLTVFHRKKKAENEKLTNYVFKYYNIEKETNLIDYKVPNAEIKLEKENSNKNKGTNYHLEINPVLSKNKFNVTYIIKLITKENLIENESLQTIAITESLCAVKEFYNPEVINEKIKFSLSELKTDYDYIQIVAEINDGFENEYLVYNNLIVIQNEKNKSTAITLALLILFGLVLCGIALTIIIILLKRNKSKNDNLIKKVQQISFLEDENEKKEEGLQLYEDKEEII